MSRRHALIEICKVLEQVPANRFGEGEFFDEYGAPSCSIGHALCGIPGAFEKYRLAGAFSGSLSGHCAAECLGIFLADVHCLMALNDDTPPEFRKQVVIQKLKELANV